MWKSGSGHRTPAPSPSSIPGNHDATWIALATRFRCVSIANLGVPVVPPVGCSTAVSSGEASEPKALAGASARSLNRFGVRSVCGAGFHRPSRLALSGYSQRMGIGSESWMPVTM